MKRLENIIVFGALSQQYQYNVLLDPLRHLGLYPKTKPISYTDSQIIIYQTEDQISRVCLHQIDYRQKSNNNFNIGKTILTGFAGLMGAAEATTTAPLIYYRHTKQEPERSKLKSLSSIPMISVSKHCKRGNC